MQVGEVVDLDVEMERLEAPVAVDEVQVDDVGVLGAEDSRHRAERARDILEHDGEARRTARPLTPGKVEPIGVDSARQGVAADDVNLDLLVLAPKPNDPVARDRVTALGEVISDAGSQSLD